MSGIARLLARIPELSSPAPGSNEASAASVGVGVGHNSATTGMHVAYALLVVAWICVIMKLSVKLFIDRRKWKMHDYFACIALAFATAEVIVAGIDVEEWGEGQHLSTVPKGNLNTVLRLLDHMYIMYDLAIMFVKLSILAFYLALFEIKPRFRYMTYAMMSIVVIYLTIFFFIDIFRCTPVKKMWYPVTVKGKCLNGVYEQRAFGVFNSISDMIILVMPFPILLKLQMSRGKMFGLILIFSLGAFTCGAAIARCVIIWRTLGESDATYSVGPEMTWMNIEMLVGLSCGALLSSPALFRYLLRETAVGQSLISLLSRASRGSHERLPNDRHRPNTNWGREGGTPASSIRYPHGVEMGHASCTSSNKSNNDRNRAPTLGDSQIGVEKTVDVSVSHRV